MADTAYWMAEEFIRDVEPTVLQGELLQLIDEGVTRIKIARSCRCATAPGPGGQHTLSCPLYDGPVDVVLTNDGGSDGGS